MEKEPGSKKHYEDIPVARIRRSEDNPRLVLRQSEMEALTKSIQLHGIQVPITVFREDGKYTLIDGERRWLCAQKLGLRTVPALVQDKPSPLENLVVMFNIHALREQWDLLTVALKLPKVISLLSRKLGREPNERELSTQLALHRTTIRRCKYLMELPQEYRDIILEELKKPKPKQRLTEDLFIEMERALTTVRRAMPDLIPNKDTARRVLLKKFESKVIGNRVDFRKLAKIARVSRVGGSEKAAKKALTRLLKPNSYSIEQAFQESVAEDYSGRDLATRLKSLLGLLDEVQPESISAETSELLKKVVNLASKILRGRS